MARPRHLTNPYLRPVIFPPSPPRQHQQFPSDDTMYRPPQGPPPDYSQPNSSTYPPPTCPPPSVDPRRYSPPTYAPPSLNPAAEPSSAAQSSRPPQWEPSTGDTQIAQLFPYGVYHDAGADNYERGVKFCEFHPHVNAAQLVNYESVDLLRTQRLGAWTLTPPAVFGGKITRERDGCIQVKTSYDKDTDKTLVSSFPVAWGRYSPPSDRAKGVYFEVEIDKLGKDAVVALGLGCLPYPTEFRLPGWHRHSAAVHSDDGFKFFENPLGGVPYTDPIKKRGNTPAPQSANGRCHWRGNASCLD
jgi:hypothetical protein